MVPSFLWLPRDPLHTGTLPSLHRGASGHSVLHLPLSFSGLATVTAPEPSAASAVPAQQSVVAQAEIRVSL